jgi:syntaxin 5
MAPKDRTSEFHSTLASIKSRSSLPSTSSSTKGKSEAKQPLIPKENGRSTPKPGQGSKSEFGRMAGGIAKDINSTTLKLQKLAQCTFSQLPQPVHRDKSDE